MCPCPQNIRYGNREEEDVDLESFDHTPAPSQRATPYHYATPEISNYQQHAPSDPRRVRAASHQQSQHARPTDQQSPYARPSDQQSPYARPPVQRQGRPVVITPAQSNVHESAPHRLPAVPRSRCAQRPEARPAAYQSQFHSEAQESPYRPQQPQPQQASSKRSYSTPAPAQQQSKRQKSSQPSKWATPASKQEGELLITLITLITLNPNDPMNECFRMDYTTTSI